MRLCVWSLFDPLFALFLCLSHLPLHPPELWLPPFPLPCGCCRSKIPVHFAQWGVWPFGQQRPSHRLWAQLLRRLPLLRDLWNIQRHKALVLASQKTMTTTSAERSLHHCSLRSEKNQPAVDKLITLLKKVCCQVSRCLSVMLEQGDLFLMSFTR